MECLSRADGAGNDEKAVREDPAGLTSDVTGGLVGTILDGRYLILSVIGSGSSGILYKATHQLMNRIVAIKMLHPHLVPDEESLKRFQQEAKQLCSADQRQMSNVFD